MKITSEYTKCIERHAYCLVAAHTLWPSFTYCIRFCYITSRPWPYWGSWCRASLLSQEAWTLLTVWFPTSGWRLGSILLIPRGKTGGWVQSLPVCACVVKADCENAILYKTEFVEKIGHSIAVLFSSLMSIVVIFVNFVRDVWLVQNLRNLLHFCTTKLELIFQIMDVSVRQGGCGQCFFYESDSLFGFTLHS